MNVVTDPRVQPAISGQQPQQRSPTPQNAARASYELQEKYSPELVSQLTDLGVWLRDKFDETQKARRSTEDRWLKDLRQYRGRYEPPEQQRLDEQKTRAKTFAKMTRKKVKAFDNRMLDMLFPAGKDRNWDVKPTPKPASLMTPLAQDLIAQQQQQVFMQQVEQISAQSGEAPEAVAQKLQMGGFVPELDSDTLNNIQLAVAKAACDRMNSEIHDQLSQLHYKQICSKVVHSGHLYGTGIIKGPLSQKITQPVWQNAQSLQQPAPTQMAPNQQQNPQQAMQQGWTMAMGETLMPFLEFVPLWAWYPDSSARELEQMEYSFQRHLMTKSQVRTLVSRPNFDAELIEAYLKEFPDGDADLLSWETELDRDDDRNDGNPDRTRNRYELLEFYGVLNDAQLRDLGMDTNRWVVCWVLGDFVIRADEFPLDGINHPYHLYYHDKDETSIWGDGVPSIMRDDQEALNAVVRAMLDNVANTVGPQYEINTDLLKPGEKTRDIFPNRIWYRRGDSRQPAIRTVETSSRLNEFLQLKATFEQQIHENTLPAYMQGAQAGGAGRTASGLSMLMGSANLDIKEQVMSFDLGITRPLIRGMYLWNMQFNNDDSLKGDYEVVAKGSSSLVAKELRSNQLDQMLPMLMQPPFLPHIDVKKLLEEVFKVRDLLDSEILLTPEQFDERQQMAAQIQELQGQVNMGTALVEQLNRIAPTLLRQAMDRIKLPNPQQGAG